MVWHDKDLERHIDWDLKWWGETEKFNNWDKSIALCGWCHVYAQQQTHCYCNHWLCYVIHTQQTYFRITINNGFITFSKIIHHIRIATLLCKEPNNCLLHVEGTNHLYKKKVIRINEDTAIIIILIPKLFFFFQNLYTY